MEGIVDIHSHILFSVDDGANSLESSIEMLKQGISEGVSTFCLTPHIYEIAEYDEKNIKNHFDILQKEIKKQNLDCNIILGGETHFTHDLFDHLKNGNGVFGNTKRNILFELPFSMFPFTAFDVIHKMVKMGYNVILAHPERNRGILSDPLLLDKLKKLGTKFQVTAGSVTGRFGRVIRNFSIDMLKEDYVDYLASDAHNLSGRNFFIKECAEIIEIKFGDKFAKKLLIDNPTRDILE